METRQFNQFENMSARETRGTVSEGLDLIVQHVEDLLKKANLIEGDAPRLAEIVRNLAEEEAGKAFVLVDYLRPTAEVTSGERSNHLKYATDHMARGIYGRYYRTRPATFREVIEFVKSNRRSHHLNGPYGVEWVFRNRIVDEREKLLYVDYVDREGETEWRSPVQEAERMLEAGTLVSQLPPRICRVLLAMYACGLFQSESLGLLAEVWENVELTPDTRSVTYRDLNETWLERCRREEVVAEGVDEEQLNFVVECFLFPLCGQELYEDDVLEEMKERQARARRNPGRFI